MKKVYVLLGAILAVPASYAHNLTAPVEGSNEKAVSPLNVGAGLSNKLAHLNVEWVNPYGIAYVKGGVFINGDRVPASQIGFRSPVHLTGKEKNGYYIGAYAGHVDRKWLDGDDEARLGAGVDLSYVMLSRERISTFGIGIAVAEEMKDRSGYAVAEVEPRLQFSYTLSFGL